MDVRPTPRLRPVRAEDVDVFYRQQVDPESQRMAAFLAPDPNDRAAFLERWAAILGNPKITARTIESDDEVVGHTVAFPEGDQLHVGYWIGRAHWGRGLATAALALLIEELGPRELHACTAKHNVASARVLEKNGFSPVEERTSYAAALDRDVVEILWRRVPT